MPSVRDRGLALLPLVRGIRAGRHEMRNVYEAPSATLLCLRVLYLCYCALPLGRSLEGVTDLSGTWRSVYEYPSSSRGGTFTSEHEVTLTQDGSTVRVRSFGSRSRIMIDLQALEVEDQVVLTGEWTEVTDPAGPYEGRRYHGGVQMLLSEDGHRMSGRWVGHNRALTEINAGTWQLERISERD